MQCWLQYKPRVCGTQAFLCWATLFWIWQRFIVLLLGFIGKTICTQSCCAACGVLQAKWPPQSGWWWQRIEWSGWSIIRIKQCAVGIVQHILCYLPGAKLKRLGSWKIEPGDSSKTNLSTNLVLQLYVHDTLMAVFRQGGGQSDRVVCVKTVPFHQHGRGVCNTFGVVQHVIHIAITFSTYVWDPLGSSSPSTPANVTFIHTSTLAESPQKISIHPRVCTCHHAGPASLTTSAGVEAPEPMAQTGAARFTGSAERISHRLELDPAGKASGWRNIGCMEEHDSGRWEPAQINKHVGYSELYRTIYSVYYIVGIYTRNIVDVERERWILSMHPNTPLSWSN